MLGVYLALIVVNCIILGRAEMYASKKEIETFVTERLDKNLSFSFQIRKANDSNDGKHCKK